MRTADYAVYKGDTFICLGTAKECAEFIGVKPETIHFMFSPTYKKRVRSRRIQNALTVIRIEDDEE